MGCEQLDRRRVAQGGGGEFEQHEENEAWIYGARGTGNLKFVSRA